MTWCDMIWSDVICYMIAYDTVYANMHSSLHSATWPMALGWVGYICWLYLVILCSDLILYYVCPVVSHVKSSLTWNSITPPSYLFRHVPSRVRMWSVPGLSKVCVDALISSCGPNMSVHTTCEPVMTSQWVITAPHNTRMRPSTSSVLFQNILC